MCAQALDLSLVIICCDDPRVFAAIDSVDADVPIIVSLVPNSDLESAISARGVTVTHSVRGNYSISCNRGLAVVDTKRAFIIDSDCILHAGCLSRIDALLNTAPLARAYVEFATTPKVHFSRLTAKFHDNINNRRPMRAYTPGLGLRIDVAQGLGGYFFDERVFWASDSELSHRVQKADLSVAYSPEAVITHAPISLTHLMHSAFRMGKGNYAQVQLGLRLPYENPTWLIRRLVRWLSRDAIHGPRQNGAMRLIQWGWTVAFYVGHYSSYVRRST